MRAGLSDAQLTFQLAMQYCLLAYDDVLNNLVHELSDALARQTARYGLAQYFAAAVTMPYTEFLETAESTRYDIDRIASIFGTGFETTAQRLTTLQRPGARACLSYLFAPIARAIFPSVSPLRHSTFPALAAPARCGQSTAPLKPPTASPAKWPPCLMGTPICGLPGTQGQVKSFGTPRKEFAVGLGCNISQADKLIYSDALNLSPSSATPIGPGCTICPREACPQRAFPQQGREHAINVNTTSDTPFDVA